MYSGVTVFLTTMAQDVSSAMMNVVFHQDQSVSTVECVWMKWMVSSVSVEMASLEITASVQVLRRR